MPLKTPICDFGQTAIDFELKSTDNEIIKLNDFKGENGTLIMFICNHCPYVKAIIDDVVIDCKNLKDKKVKNSGENWSAPNASIIGDVTLEKNTSIWFNVTLRGDVENIHIGEGSNVQDGSVLHTDPGYPLRIGKNVTIGHLVMLHGCTIEDNSLIGIGAVTVSYTHLTLPTKRIV